MKLDYETNARLAIAKILWEQFRGIQCLSTGKGTIVSTDLSACNVLFDWRLYPSVLAECKEGGTKYKFIDSNACVLQYDTLKKDLDANIDKDTDVKAAVLELELDPVKLKESFNEAFYKIVETYLRKHLDTKNPYITDEQGRILIAHCILMENDGYQEVIGAGWKYASWGFHLWNLDLVKIGVIVGVGLLLIVITLAASARGDSPPSAPSQTVIIQMPPSSSQ